ncbi:MAG TPA: T9SS type A sorting domain-containing protein [Caldithrix abyssi]|uniref:T9SS type A sorting domain-containing protein n=1 Tax=Caldithrix abyssi TaxID=187145 RepID=A0A7V1LQC8_CALAY|nr:T9SS type A sorting domain-containing protein [Caldithrix abyssi]
MKKLTVLLLGLMLGTLVSLQAQTMDFKSGYQFPTIDQDSVLSGLRSIRGSDVHPNPLGDGVSGLAVTNYADEGHIHVFKNTGDDAMELVWTSPAWDSLGGGSMPRIVKWADLDGDGLIELIAPFNLNGIAIYEWDGVAGSWNFGTEGPSFVITGPLFASTQDSGAGVSKIEYLDVADVDGDGQMELMFANNSDGSEYDRYYVFSIDGDYSTDDPGFAVANREAMYYKSKGEYAAYGGGTPYAVVAADLDGNGQKEMVFHNWNYGHFTVVRGTAPDTYELADTTGGKNYVYSNYPDDCVSLGGGTPFDVDGDGREEVYFPLYSANGLVLMVHFEEGDTLTQMDSTNAFLLDAVADSDSRFDFFGRAGFGDYDNDGKPNLYFAARHGKYIMSAEFQGGDKTDQANWTTEVLYTGLDLDSTIYSKMTITDSAGVVDTVFSLQADTEGTIAMKIFSNHTDFDKDSYQDIIMPSQTWKDSIDVLSKVWLKDSSYVVYDTMYANTDSMKIDTVDVTESIFSEESYKIVEPNRISLRFLESSALFTGIKEKQLTIITPADYKLEQNYPNPFNPSTTIQFFLPVKKEISLVIYNSSGQKVKTLVNNQVFNKGRYVQEWDGTNDNGKQVASGMYIYKLKFGNFSKSKRMLLVK